MPLLKFQHEKRTVPGNSEFRSDAELYEVYAREARERNEEELAEFFDELAAFFYLQAEKSAVVTPDKSLKNALRERWHSWKELFDF